MTNDQFIAMIKQMIADADNHEQQIAIHGVNAPPAWANYFHGYRDALRELIVVIKDETETHGK